MTQENPAGEGPGAAGDDNSPHDQTPRAASLAPDPVSAEPKGYPDAAEKDCDAQPEQSISGEEEDFLSE